MPNIEITEHKKWSLHYLQKLNHKWGEIGKYHSTTGREGDGMLETCYFHSIANSIANLTWPIHIRTIEISNTNGFHTSSQWKPLIFQIQNLQHLNVKLIQSEFSSELKRNDASFEVICFISFFIKSDSDSLLEEQQLMTIFR